MSKIDHIRDNISSLEGELKGLDETLDLDPDSLLPPVDMLDGIQDIEVFDYDKELKDIQVDCNETLDCLSSLYLNAEDIEKRNIHNIIKNDANSLADLNFTLSCSMILSLGAFSTLSILPFKGRIAWKRRSRPCLAEPPAESPSTK